MDDVTLLPCPFCGGPAEIWRAQSERTAWIGCMGRCSVLVSKEYKTDAEAIDAWNRRTPASDGRAEGLREAATDRVTDWLVPEMADEIARLRAENGVLRDDHGRLQTKACVAVDAARNAEAESPRLRAEVERLREAERTAWEPPPAWERPFNFECLGWVYGGWDFVFWNDTHWVTRKGNPCTPGHFRPMPPAPKQEPH